MNSINHKKINGTKKSSEEIEKSKQTKPSININSAISTDALWWENPDYLKNLNQTPRITINDGLVNDIAKLSEYPLSQQIGSITQPGAVLGLTGKSISGNMFDHYNSGVASTFNLNTVQNSPFLHEMGLGIINGAITLKGKSITDLEKEEREIKFEEINQRILHEKEKTESALMDEKEKRQQAESKISILESKLLSLGNDFDTLNKFLSLSKGKKHQKNKLPKAKHIYQQLVIYENGKVAFNGKPFHLPLIQISILTLLMKIPGEVVTYDDILENCYPAHKRYNVRKSKTLAKYISALHRSLKVHFNKKVISNEKGVGWALIV